VYTGDCISVVLRMSKGLGERQVEIKAVLTVLWRKKLPMRFADIRAWVFAYHDGEEGDMLAPTFERSMRRALNGLLARGDVVVVGGKGTPSYPREFMTVGDFARLSGKKVRNTVDAKKIAAEGKEIAAEVVMAARLVAAARSHRAAAVH
jgi:hypothetical protein